MRLRPAPGVASGALVARGKRGVVRVIDARGDGRDGGEIGGGTGALERRRAGADHVAHGLVRLRHDEAREALAGLFVENAAIRLLHRQHPLEIPADFVEHVRRLVLRLGEIERDVETPAVNLPHPQQRPGGDAGIDDVAAVITGVVPTP
jgi:hypothetical protein